MTTCTSIRPIYYDRAEVRGVTDIWIEHDGCYYSRLNHVIDGSPGQCSFHEAQFLQRQRIYRSLGT